MEDVFKQQILKFLSRREQLPIKSVALAGLLNVRERDLPDFEAAVAELAKQGKIDLGRGNQIDLPDMRSTVVGTFRANPKGFGFVIPTDLNAHGDLFIGPSDCGDAMSGDMVAARPMRKGYRKGEMRYNGVIVEIITRGNTKLVGNLGKVGSQWVVQPDGKAFINPIAVDDVTVKGAKADDKVCVEIIRYPTETSLARGVITEVLGRAGAYDTEIEAIRIQYSLPGEFGEECLQQARDAAGHFDSVDVSKRDDITDDVLITIDPPDAKDFDDAISLRKNPDGNWVLGVHIADVSTFVKMDSPLDIEAQNRGNSVYLPGKVIPMLPEILSNGICSLQPDQKRFAKSAYITYDKRGNVLDRNYANSIIKSRARLTYTQADEIIKGHAKGVTGEVVALLKDMDDLARAIEKRRTKNGMLHLDLPETELVMDENGKVIDANPAENSYPHTIIEMFMVEANEAVASLMDRFNIPFIRRIHPEPDSSKMKDLGSFVKICGIKLPRQLDRAAIQDLLESVKGTGSSYAINLHILRSLQKAEYAPLHIGHFALASVHYAHFTSPIRRYADLLLHRLLDCYLEHKLNMIGLEEVLPEVTLAEIGNHISLTEQNAINAERELKNVLVLELFSEKVGEEIDCVVSGITGFGIFVQCMKYGVEGLIELADLGLDEWKYDRRKQAVIGLHSGKSVHLGNEMKVRILSVNVPARQLSLGLSKPLVSTREEYGNRGRGYGRGKGRNKGFRSRKRRR
ncbi:MAG: ribonuclease R [Planctomycetes bacterium]|nr:ribonuclease R [Planctomycetota bacterium]